jgi:hypothetical protein
MANTTSITAMDIRRKWDRLSETESSAIKNTESLVAQVSKSYGLSKEQAQSDVTAWVAGRNF